MFSAFRGQQAQVAIEADDMTTLYVTLFKAFSVRFLSLAHATTGSWIAIGGDDA